MTAGKGNEEESFDVLTVFIIIMGICSLVIGIWGLMAYSKLGEKEAHVDDVLMDTKRMKMLIQHPSNKSILGNRTTEIQDVTAHGENQTKSLSTYLIDMAAKCRIQDRKTKHGKPSKGEKTKDYTEYYIEEQLQGVIAFDLYQYIRTVEANAAGIRARKIVLTRFKEDENGDDYIFNATVRFNVYSKTPPPKKKSSKAGK